MSQVYRYLTNDGLVADGTNEKVISASADKYYAGPADGEYWHITRMIIYIEDGTSPKINEYGAASALSNGCLLRTTRGGPDGIETLDLLGGIAVHSNGDWASLCFDIDLSIPGSGNGVVIVRWTFDKAGEPVILHGSRGDKIVLETRDAMNALVDHRFMLQGHTSDMPHGHGSA